MIRNNHFKIFSRGARKYFLTVAAFGRVEHSKDYLE
jgi:hypothetical protein